MDLKARVMVATPSYDGTLDRRFVESLNMATVYSLMNGVELVLKIEAGHSLIQFARNRLAQDFLNDRDYTHILWLDSDVGFDPRAIVQLFAHGKDVAGGAYPVKDFPVWFPVEALDPDADTALPFKAKSLPTGFLLLTRKAMQAAADGVGEYIHHHQRKQLLTKHIFDLVLEGDGPVKALIGEDVVLCRRLIKLGFDLWCDPDINFFHCGRFEWKGNLKQTTEFQRAQQPTPLVIAPTRELILPPDLAPQRSRMADAVVS